MQNQQPPPRISAIVCTYNNAQTLGHTLASLARQQLPPNIGYEVVIVDNNSTDHTPEVAKRFVESHGTLFRYVREPRQGLSFARNRGVAEARGEIVAFIDDDAIADDDWLSELTKAYDQDHQAGCVGGTVNLQMPFSRLPEWYDERLNGFLSARDMPSGVARSHRDFPFGVNISFQRSAVMALGGFHPLLGWGSPAKNIRLGGEESEMALRLFRAGYHVLFQASARVTHVVAEQRLRKEYFLGQTRGAGYLRVIFENDGVLGVSTREQLRRNARRCFKHLWRFLSPNPFLSERERFWNHMWMRIYAAATWYCLVAKHQLRRLDASVRETGTTQFGAES